MEHYKEWYQDNFDSTLINSFAARLFLELPWITVKRRKQATLGHIPYTFSGNTYPATPILGFIFPLLEKVNNFTGIEFNTIHCNFYPNGSVGLGRHTDNEPEHINDTIVSLSFGASRHFIVGSDRISLASGDLLIFDRHQFHSVPTDNNPRGRISLTFRVFR